MGNITQTGADVHDINIQISGSLPSEVRRKFAADIGPALLSQPNAADMQMPFRLRTCIGQLRQQYITRRGRPPPANKIRAPPPPAATRHWPEGADSARRLPWAVACGHRVGENGLFYLQEVFKSKSIVTLNFEVGSKFEIGIGLFYLK